MDPKEILKNEGFVFVEEWSGPPSTDYPEHAHRGRLSFIVTKGSFIMVYPDRKVIVNEGMRHDVPVGVPHSGRTGSEGVTMIEGSEFNEEDDG